jgi:hypothetical protein
VRKSENICFVPFPSVSILRKLGGHGSDAEHKMFDMLQFKEPQFNFFD